MTVSLKMVSPTSVSVLRALEIILAYICQVLVMNQIPNALCILGSTLVVFCVIGIAIDEKLSSSNEQNAHRSLQIGRTYIFTPNLERV